MEAAETTSLPGPVHIKAGNIRHINPTLDHASRPQLPRFTMPHLNQVRPHPIGMWITSRPYKRDFHTHVGRDSNLDIRTPEDGIVIHFVAGRNLGAILLSPLCSDRPHYIQNINQSLSLAHFHRNLTPHPLPQPGQ